MDTPVPSFNPAPARETPFAANVRRAVEAMRPTLPRDRAPQIVARVLSSFLAVRASSTATVEVDGQAPMNAYDACTPASVAACVAQAIGLDLYPDGGSLCPAYIVPQAPRKGARPDLQFRPNHRGIATVAARRGVLIRAVPVAQGDHLVVSLGELIEHEPADPTVLPTVETLAGVGVSVRLLVDGVRLDQTVWVPLAVIQASQAMSRSRTGPWQTHPIEMAMGAAIRWVARRGAIPADLPALAQAIDLSDTYETEQDDAPTVPAAASAPAQAPKPPRQSKVPTPKGRELPDHSRMDGILDPPAEEREKVPVDEDDAMGWG